MEEVWFKATKVLTKKGEEYVRALESTVKVSATREGDKLSDKQREAYIRFVSIEGSMRNKLLHPLALIASDEMDFGCEDPMIGKKRADVWDMVELSSLYIPAHGNTNDRYILICGTGDWEDTEEYRHSESDGVFLLFKNEELFEFSKYTEKYSGLYWEEHYISE